MMKILTVLFIAVLLSLNLITGCSNLEIVTEDSYMSQNLGIPPIDTVPQPQIETATFALG